MVVTQQQFIRARVRRSAVVREQEGLKELTFHAMGTRCRVLLAGCSLTAGNAYLDTVLNWVADFESKYSRFLEGSLISRINAAAGCHWVEVDEETERLIQLCADLNFFTRGAFDPTSLPLTRLWNWKAKPAVIPEPKAIREAMELVGIHKVLRRPGGVFLPRAGMCLDFGGIGKEYAVDYVAAMAAHHGIKNVLVDFGQDIRAHGQPPGRPAWHIGLEDPRQPGLCWASVAVRDHAVASSGDYLRHFVHAGKRYGHIIDPRTGDPVSNGSLAVNVVAPTCTVAGILSTTAFILGPQDGYHSINSHHGASGAILTENGNSITPRFYEHMVQQN